MTRRALLALATLAGLGADDAPAEPGLGYLGMRVRAAEGTIWVAQVFPGSGAEEAGLQEGDTLTQVDGHPLAGLAVKEAVALLTGPPGTRAALDRDPFPPGGPTDRLRVERRPLPAPAPEGKSFLPPVEREANIIGGSLRSGRTPPIDGAARVWADAKSQDEADRAVLRALREADAAGWANALTTAQREVFWSALAASEPFKAWLAGRPLPTRAHAAGLLARHRASAPLARALLPEPDPGPEGTAARTLAEAVLAADPAAAAAAGWSPPDLWGPAGEAVLGPRAGDLAALELTLDAARGARPPGLPEAAAARLERTGMRLPWSPAAPMLPFAEVEAARIAPFTARTPDGGALDLAAHQGPVVIAFWATWCGPCRQELPHLQALRDAHLGQGLEVWALSTDKPADRPKIPQVWADLGLTLPVALAPSALVQAWDVGNIPRVVVLDAGHRKVLDHQGFSEESFEELTGHIRSLLEGSLKGQRTLGQIAGDPAAFTLLGTGDLWRRPDALLADPAGRLWVLAGGELAPVTRDGERLVVGAGRPLPLDADLAAWVDLEVGGAPALLLADAKAGTLRASRADGSLLWTRRDPAPIGGLGTLRAEDGALLLAALRAGTALVDPPAGTRGVPAGEQVEVPRHRIELIDPGGGLRLTLPLDQPVVAFAAAPDGRGLALALADGQVLALGPDLAWHVVAHPLERPRGLAWVEGGVVVTGGLLRDLLTGRGRAGPWRLGLTGGGDLVALTPAGEAGARLDLQRAPVVAVGDLDADGLDEALLWTPWFGLAALR